MTLDDRAHGDAADELMGVRETAEVLGVHPNTVRNWGAAGKLRELRTGARSDRRYYRTDVDGIKAKLLTQQEKRSSPIADLESVGTIYGSGFADLVDSYQRVHSMFSRNYDYIAAMARSMSAFTLAAKQMVPLSHVVSQMLLPSSGVI